MSDRQWVVVPMQEADVDTALAIETAVAAFPWSRGNFTDCLKAGYSGWVLRRGTADGEVVGFAMLMMAVDEGHLLNLGVALDYQRLGLGSRLLDQVLTRTQASGGNSLMLEVRPSNDKALALYRRYGFNEIGRRKGYYPAAVGREDALVLRRPVNQT